ncbi:MAG: hypothetical protein EOO11_14050 [Chitinophagaceae bacterium]|nr:MAG: hypothetical protein EOO11_14050 [Chitinophagaceae bacterium]
MINRDRVPNFPERTRIDKPRFHPENPAVQFASGGARVKPAPDPGYFFNAYARLLPAALEILCKNKTSHNDFLATPETPRLRHTARIETKETPPPPITNRRID